MKKLLQSLFILLFVAGSAMAQNRTITGTVTDNSDGKPLPGVTVRIVGSKTGTQTGANGKYSLVVTGPGTLEFSYLGYAATTKSIPSSGVLNVVLTEDAKGLSEVVVVGYGTIQRKDVTGSVSSIKGDELADKPVASFDQALAGKVTGVQVTQSSGILGSAPRIRIRGTSSISSGSDPLYVVDGMPIITGSQSGILATNPLGDINPNDIQSVDVLKDGAATAIYGSRAAGGVIIITTKKGVAGRPAVNYSAWFGSARTAKRFSLLDANQFIEIANEKLANTVPTTTPKAFPMYLSNGQEVNTNWQDVVFNKNAFQQNQALSVSGGTDKSNYYFSLGYTDMMGVIVGNRLTKYQVSGKLEQKALNDRVTFGISSSVSYVKNLGLNIGTTGLSGNVGNALRALPNVPVFNEDGSYNLSSDNARLGRGANTKEIDDNYTNIKYILDHNVYRNQNVTLLGNAFMNVNIIKGLDFKTQISTNALFGEDFQYLNPVHGDGGSATKGSEFQQYIPSFRYNWVNTLNYVKVIGDHSINAIAGFEFQKGRYRSFFASGSLISSEFFGGQNIISNSLSQPTFNIGGGVSENSLAAYFVRGNYSYKDKYLLSATFRSDRISSLPLGNQKANLPGASIGWRLSKEDFFKNSEALSFVTDLKLRGGFAKVGNTDIGNYPFAGTFGAATYGTSNGLYYSQAGNPNLVFETSNKIDVGLDLSMFKGRVNLTADYFKNNIDNLILAAPTAPSLGVPGNSINQNIGKMTNKGFELGINTVNVSTDDFSWTTGLNLSFVKNEITQLANNNADITFTYNINRVGRSIGELYGYDFVGVNAANGNPLYRKATGQIIQGNIQGSSYFVYDPANPTALTTASTLSATDDRKLLGKTNPTYFGGFTNTFTYKGFDLNVNIVFSGGNKVMNITKQEGLMNQKFLNNGTAILDRWNTVGQETDVPKLYYGRDAFTNLTASTVSRFVEKGDFIRGQDIILGYSLPKELLSKASVNRLRVFAQVQNAFIITKYTGLDPELNQSVTTNSQAGLDYNTNPKARTFIVGVNIGF